MPLGVFLIGGFDTNSVEVIGFDNCSVPDLPELRYDHGSFITGWGSLAVCGGWWEGKSISSDCLVLKNGVWMGGEVDDLPDQRHYSASARLDVGVFILGGWYTESSSVFLRANSRSWVQGPQLPVAMKRPCAAPISAHS